MLPAEAIAMLGLRREATDDERKAAYKRLALQFHPDRNRGDPDATAKFQRIQAANECLQTWFVEKAEAPAGRSSRAFCSTLSIPDPAWWAAESENFDHACLERQAAFRRNVERELSVISEMEQEHGAYLLRRGEIMSWLAGGDRVYDHWAKERQRLQRWGNEMVARVTSETETLKRHWGVLERLLRTGEQAAAGGFLEDAAAKLTSALRTMDEIDQLKLFVWKSMRVMMLHQRSGIWSGLQKHTKAVQDAELASKIDPTDVLARAQLARAYRNGGRRADALKAFSSAASLAMKKGNARQHSECRYHAQTLQAELDREQELARQDREREQIAKDAWEAAQRAELEAEARRQRQEATQRRVELAHELRTTLASADVGVIRAVLARATAAGVPESDLHDARRRLDELRAREFEAELRSMLERAPTLKALQAARKKGEQLGAEDGIRAAP